MVILQLNNMGAALRLPEVARNHYMGLVRCRPDMKVIVVRDRSAAEEARVEFVTPPPWMAGRRILRNVWRLGMALRIVRTRGAEAVHCVHLWPHGLIGSVVARLTGVPLVISVVAGVREAWLYGGVVGRAGRWALRKADLVTTTGKISRRGLIDSVGLDPSRVVVLPNVIDTASYACAAATGYDERPYDIIATSRFYAVKNMRTAVEAVAEVIQWRGRTGRMTRAVLCGDGPELSAIRDWARERGVLGCIEFAGNVDAEGIRRLLCKSRVFLLTSLAEGFPMGVLEALASGLPCVVSNVGDVADLVRDGENGILVGDARNATEFAAGLLRVLESPCRWEEMSREARRGVGSFSYERSAECWEGILRRVTPRRGGGIGRRGAP